MDDCEVSPSGRQADYHGELKLAKRGYAVLCKDKDCGWKGYRKGYNECECYEDWAMCCRPWSPGPGCPSWILWPCPRCKGDVSMNWPVYNKVFKEIDKKYETTEAAQDVQGSDLQGERSFPQAIY